MHGLGNDFLVIDAREQPVVMTAPLARALADRHRGIGYDQLILLRASNVADLRLEIVNADGSPAEACGNATRCIVALTGAETIETDGGILHGMVDGTSVEVTLEPPRTDWADIPLAYPMDTAALPMGWDELGSPAAVNIGNPHLVFFVDAIDEQRLAILGPVIEHDPAFPERINVNLAVGQADGSIALRTFERGAGLTEACGTGACATAVAAIMARRARTPVTVHMKGGDLVIAWAPGEKIRMTGPATHVFSGEIDLDALLSGSSLFGSGA